MTTLGGGDPEPGDVVIGIGISCNATAPGLDTKKDRVVRISYRPSGAPPMPPKKKVNPPPKPEGAFPLPGNPDKDDPTAGVTVDADGVVWIDTEVFGQPPADAPGLTGDTNRGDDSEDVASRINEAVEAASADPPKLIDPDDIRVEHNGQSDVDPKEGPCPDGKPQGNGRGLGRIVLRKPSHVDAASDYSKIRVCILVLDPPAGSAPTVVKILPDSVPSQMPDEREDDDGDDPDDEWEPTAGSDKTERRRAGQGGEKDDRQKPMVPDLLRKKPWGKPPKKSRRFGMSNEGGLFQVAVPEPSETENPIAVSLFCGDEMTTISVDCVEDRAEQIRVLADGMRRGGMLATVVGGDRIVIVPPARSVADRQLSGFAIEWSGNWHFVVERNLNEFRYVDHAEEEVGRVEQNPSVKQVIHEGFED